MLRHIILFKHIAASDPPVDKTIMTENHKWHSTMNSARVEAQTDSTDRVIHFCFHHHQLVSNHINSIMKMQE